MQPPDHDTDLESTYYSDRRRRTVLAVVAVLAFLALAGGLSRRRRPAARLTFTEPT